MSQRHQKREERKSEKAKKRCGGGSWVGGMCLEGEVSMKIGGDRKRERGRVRHTTVDSDVEPAGFQLLDPLHNIRVLGEVDNFDPRALLRERQAVGYDIDANDALRRPS